MILRDNAMKWLLGLALLAYLTIYVPNDGFNVIRLEIVLFGFLSVYDFWTLALYIIEWVGPLLCLWLVVGKGLLSLKSEQRVWLCLILLYIPLVYQHYGEEFSISKYDHAWCVIPEIIFWTFSFIVLGMSFGIRRNRVSVEH